MVQKIDIVNLLIKHPVENKILAVKRSSLDKTYGGMWALPGGSIEEGETEHEAAKRELMEETGLNLISMENIPEIISPLEVGGKTYIIGVYKAAVVEGVPEPHDKDISAVEYIDLSLLLKSLQHNKYPEEQIKILERYLSNPKNNIDMNYDNESVAVNSLRQVISILNKYEINYRFLGSIITCALKDEVYRKISDLDLLVDKNKQEILAEELIKLGYSKKTKNHLRLSESLNLHIYHHPKMLETSFYGLDFLDDGSATLRMPHVRATVEKHAIEPTKYKLKDTSFVGIPASVVYKTILYSKSNPKRKPEFEILTKLGIRPYGGNIYKVTAYGLDISYLPRLASFVLELIGIVRIRLLGKKYDMWK